MVFTAGTSGIFRHSFGYSFNYFFGNSFCIFLFVQLHWVFLWQNPLNFFQESTWKNPSAKASLGNFRSNGLANSFRYYFVILYDNSLRNFFTKFCSISFGTFFCSSHENLFDNYLWNLLKIPSITPQVFFILSVFSKDFFLKLKKTLPATFLENCLANSSANVCFSIYLRVLLEIC